MVFSGIGLERLKLETTNPITFSCWVSHKTTFHEHEVAEKLKLHDEKLPFFGEIQRQRTHQC